MTTHANIPCDGCGCEPIQGDRYQCLQCDNYDLCHDCFSKKIHGNNSNHLASHSAVLMRADDQLGFCSYHTVYCDGCRRENYIGRRYRCLQCRFFDVCEFCYSTENFGPNEGRHLVSHRTQVILTPLDRLATPCHKGIYCDGCRTENISGARYQCTKCEHYDLCERCHATENFTCYDGASKGAYHSSYHEMTKSNAPIYTSHTFRTWKAISIKTQNGLGKDVGSRGWDVLDTNTSAWTDLGRKIGYALYHLPTIDPSTSKWCIFGYERDKEEKIKKLRQQALDLSASHTNSHMVYVNFIFVSFWTKDNESMLPLIRVLKYEKNGKPHSYFIEPSGRTYDGWDDFIDKNLLPECHTCYPENGWYKFDDTDDCKLCFGKSAECDSGRQIVKSADITTTIMGTVGTGIALIGLFTPLAPLAVAAVVGTTLTAGTYGAARSTYKLVDRSMHGQSINPFSNKESFFCWLGIVGFGLSFGATAATSYVSVMATRGTHVGQLTRIAATAAIFGNMGVNSVGVLAGVGNLVDKAIKGEEVTALEIFQLSASVLFLANQTMNIQTASKIIKSVQQQRIDQLRPFLTEDQQEAFDLLIKNHCDNAMKQGNAKTGQMHGGEQTVRAVNRAKAQNDLRQLFEYGISREKFQSGNTTYTTIGARNQFPIRHASKSMGVRHIVDGHGKQFAQRGYANNSEGVLQALKDHMTDERFMGFHKEYSRTYWKTDYPNTLFCVVFTEYPSGYLSNTFGQYTPEIVTAYFVNQANLNSNCGFTL